MTTELKVTYEEFLGLLLTYTAKSDDDFDLSEKYMLTKKVDFEDISKAETIIKNFGNEEVMEIIKKNYLIFRQDDLKKQQIRKDLVDIINSDGYVHETEQKILDAIDRLDKEAVL